MTETGVADSLEEDGTGAAPGADLGGAGGSEVSTKEEDMMTETGTTASLTRVRTLSSRVQT